MPGLLLLKNNFFMKSSIFVLVPCESPEGPFCRPRTLGSSRDIRGPSGDVLGVSYENLLNRNVCHPKIVVSHGSFISLKYSLTDLITQHLQENNPLFYNLWSIYHTHALSRNSNKKVNFLVFFHNSFTNSFLKYG